MSRRKKGNDNTVVGVLVLAVLMALAIALGWYGLQIEEAGKTTSTPTSSTTQTASTTPSTTSAPTNTTSQLFTVVNMTTTTSATNAGTS
jgi:hypothetical protein